MDINKNENLTDNNEQNKNELKEIFEDNSNKEDNSNNEEIPKEVLMYSKPVNSDNMEDKKKDLISETESEAGQPIGKKEMDAILLNLNPYWIELIGSIGFTSSLIIYESLGLIGLFLVSNFFGEKSFTENLTEAIYATYDVLKDLGLKWLFFITLSQHLAVGFFCLTTFSNMFQEIKNIKKFLIVNLIKVALFYVLSVIILKVIIKDKIGGFFHDKINGTAQKDNQKIHDLFDILIDKALAIVADFLATFNTFLDKFILGIMYLFLFSEPKSLMGKKLTIFRFLTLIPIIYIIVCLIIRALHNFKIIELSIYLSPLLLGPKIVVYLFFISTLVVIKYKSINYNVYDSENDIAPKVFCNIGSKIFGFFGVIELIIGLFFPSCNPAGIGGKYLLVICAPIMTLYDYKRKAPMKFPCCKKGNFNLCLKICINIILYLIIVILGIFILYYLDILLSAFILPIVNGLADNFDVVMAIINEIL